MTLPDTLSAREDRMHTGAVGGSVPTGINVYMPDGREQLEDSLD